MINCVSFNIAQGSLSECENYILLSHDLNYINEAEFQKLKESAEVTEKVLNAYCKAILNNVAVKDEYIN